MKKISLLLPAVLLTLTSASQTTVTLQCSRDAAIGFHDGAGTAGNNYGSAAQNAAFSIPATASVGGTNANRALIDFSLASIGQVSVISASLNLYALGPSGSLPGHTGTANTSHLRRITQQWGEFSVTWNNQPPATTTNQVTVPQSTSATQDYLSINVTSLVQDMVNNPSSSFGFLLGLASETHTNALLFASKDNANQAKWPTLVVRYEPISTVSLAETQNQPDLILWPVPTGDVLNVDLGARHVQRLEVMDAQGRVIMSLDEPGSVVDLKDISPGVYFLRCLTTDGLVCQRRFVHVAQP